MSGRGRPEHTRKASLTRANTATARAGDHYYRDGDDTIEATNARQIAALSARFR